MKTEQMVHREVDLGLYNRNRPKYPPEKLMAYAGQHIAFNWDGTELIGSALDYLELCDALSAKGIPRECYVVGYVDEF